MTMRNRENEFSHAHVCPKTFWFDSHNGSAQPSFISVKLATLLMISFKAFVGDEIRRFRMDRRNVTYEYFIEKLKETVPSYSKEMNSGESDVFFVFFLIFQSMRTVTVTGSFFPVIQNFRICWITCNNSKMVHWIW
jgi:hypothetical protein